MLNKIAELSKSFKQLYKSSAEYSIESYKKVLEEIKKPDYISMEDSRLRNISGDLIKRARNGVDIDELLVEAFGLVREAVRRVLGLCPFDVQIMAGIAMHQGKLVEMQTGEGKTLSAVFPAYLNAIAGNGVHILTFNDYLARRDAEWIGPVYSYLGLTVEYVTEGMTTAQKQKAYNSDITYLTAKEAGFDYLREFVCTRKEDLVLRPFNYAIVDEADSILIDEARIPLVIAGKVDIPEVSPVEVAQAVGSLLHEIEYDTDEYGRNVYLTDKGVSRIEDILKCGNLYDEKNLVLLTEVSNALHAQVLLKRDVDYIVREGSIVLIDELTGRIADKRHWPDGLQAAIEAKEGIAAKTKGKIMGSITLQNFIRLYPKLCGMTGTAQSAANEFEEFYGLKVAIIPTNRPCIRVDYPDVLFTHKDAKYKALVSEIIKVHKTGRPVLIGTCSVEESEIISKNLKNKGVDCQVLNAKNDELEAAIIAGAGNIGAVTVSTNMAGRGTDIKLGGENGVDRDKIVKLGGLYVLGTNRHESLRIDNQLRGRAGRQGDPGSTCFFISLEDDLIVRYGINELIPKPLYPQRSEEHIEIETIKKKITKAQRIIEGQNFEVRRNLSKYSCILDQQRKLMQKMRQDILLDKAPSLFREKLRVSYEKLHTIVGEEALVKAEKQVRLYCINKSWTDYLDYTSYIRDSIHLVNVAGKNPMDEFIRNAIDSFNNLLSEIENDVLEIMQKVEITESGIDMEKEGLKAPSSTWTYIVDDSAEQLGILPICINPMAFIAIVTIPLVITLAVYNRFFRKRKVLN